MDDETHQERKSNIRARRERQRLIVLAVVLAAVVAVVGAFAIDRGEDEPEGDPPGMPTQVAGLAQNIPAPESCLVAPRPVSEMQSLLATPAASPVAATPAATPGPTDGVPADAATVEQIVATYTEAIACQNAGNFARTYELYSDELVRSILGGASAELGIDPNLIAAVVGTPTIVSPMEWTAIVARGAVEMLPDGRASAVFVTVKVAEAGNSDAARPRVVYFVNEGGVWLIDGTLDPSTEATPVTSPAN